MNMEFEIIYLKDIEKPEIAKILDTIKEKNDGMYDALLSHLRSEGTSGIRDDVLKFIANHIEEFKTDESYLYNVAALVGNAKVTPDHLSWAVSYFNNRNLISIDDFMIIFSEAIEKGMPLSVIQKCYMDAGDNEVQLYEKILSYGREEEKTEETEEMEENVVGERASDEKTDNKKQELTNVSADVVEEMEEDANKTDMEEMFENLLVAMSHGNKTMDMSVIRVQEEFNKIVAKLQVDLTELTSYVTQVVREWEGDKEEIGRLNALSKIQQKVMSNQQQRINELQGKILRQENRIREAEKFEMQQAAIQRKITELGSLAASEYGENFSKEITEK